MFLSIVTEKATWATTTGWALPRNRTTPTLTAKKLKRSKKCLQAFHCSLASTPPDHNCLSFLLDSLQLNVMLLQYVPENLHAERTQLKRATGHRKGLYRQQHANFLPGKF